MITNLSHVMTLANGVIGVSVLAMPFCFKQCGIVLGILMLLLSSFLSKFACHLLVKSAVMSRRRNFEVLAFHAFGRTGKFLAELFIIGFLMGTCIAFFVVVGDLGPEIVGKIIDKSPADIRTSLLVTIGVFIILPLGLLRNVDSLSTICTATIGFYLCLVLKVMTESMAHIFATDWYDKVFYWRPSGILQCLPIFSMALFCQTQLFEIYDTIPNVCLEKMNRVVHDALNICTVVYVCVGFFGYVAFCNLPFTGNILMSFEPSLSSDAIKIGFVLSVAFSFPLVIFPCRASLNSLLFRWAHSHDTSSNYIPETRFKWLTFLIVAVSLITGILIPNIEFVLGLVGSTIGVMICLMFPAAFFITISSKNTNERLVAQAMLFVGIWIMILGTYANLYAMEESANAKLTVTTGEQDSVNQLNNIPLDLINERDAQVIPPIPKVNEIPDNINANFKPLEAQKILENTNVKDDVRQEPPIPVERAVVTEKVILDTKVPDGHPVPTLRPVIEENVEEIKKLDKNVMDKAGEDKLVYQVNNNAEGKGETELLKGGEQTKEVEAEKNLNVAIHKNDNLINSDAIKKEESELAADAELAADVERDKVHENLRKTLVQHEIEQRKMLREQQEILKTIEQQKQELKKEKMEKEASKKMGKIVERDNTDTVVDSRANEDVKNTLKVDQQPIRTKNEAQKLADPSFIENGKDHTIKNSRGPILSALAKETLNSSNANDIPTDVIRDNIKTPDSNLALNQRIEESGVGLKYDGANLSNNNVQSLNNNHVQVPIALAMGDKTKKDVEKSTLPKKLEENVAIGRDILENPERRKREIDKVMVSEDGKQVEKLILVPDVEVTDKLEGDNAARGDLDQECAKTDGSPNNFNKKAEDVENLKETGTTEQLLIKTNSYLSDQSFVDPNSLGKNFDLNINFEKSNQRDLKSLSSKNGNKK